MTTTIEISRAALEEDVDAVGLSLLSGAHLTLFPEVVKRLRKSGLKDVLIFGGGINSAGGSTSVGAAGENANVTHTVVLGTRFSNAKSL